LTVFKIDEVPPERCPAQPQSVDHQPSTPDLSLFHYLNPIFVLLVFVGHSLVFQGVQRHTEREYGMAQDRLRNNNNKNPNHNLTKFPSVTPTGVRISPV
jgi:hypothetical protein